VTEKFSLGVIKAGDGTSELFGGAYCGKRFLTGVTTKTKSDFEHFALSPSV
jgi:hypothetical protein